MLRFILGAEKPAGADARDLVEKGALLVDVRTPEEFALEHVLGARNIPVQELPDRLIELGPPERPLVIYCRSGARSSTAKQMLLNAGFKHVHDLGAMLNVKGIPRKTG